jgi:hypothetical protein
MTDDIKLRFIISFPKKRMVQIQKKMRRLFVAVVILNMVIIKNFGKKLGTGGIFGTRLVRKG